MSGRVGRAMSGRSGIPPAICPDTVSSAPLHATVRGKARCQHGTCCTLLHVLHVLHAPLHAAVKKSARSQHGTPRGYVTTRHSTWLRDNTALHVAT
jgi:hypothetical protein